MLSNDIDMRSLIPEFLHGINKTTLEENLSWRSLYWNHMVFDIESWMWLIERHLKVSIKNTISILRVALRGF